MLLLSRGLSNSPKVPSGPRRWPAASGSWGAGCPHLRPSPSEGPGVLFPQGLRLSVCCHLSSPARPLRRFSSPNTQPPGLWHPKLAVFIAEPPQPPNTPRRCANAHLPCRALLGVGPRRNQNSNPWWPFDARSGGENGRKGQPRPGSGSRALLPLGSEGCQAAGSSRAILRRGVGAWQARAQGQRRGPAAPHARSRPQPHPAAQTGWGALSSIPDPLCEHGSAPLLPVPVWVPLEPGGPGQPPQSLPGTLSLHMSALSPREAT